MQHTTAYVHCPLLIISRSPNPGVLKNLLTDFPFQGAGQDYRHMCLQNPDPMLQCVPHL